MKIFQSYGVLSLTLLLLASLQSIVCDTSVVHDENNCSTRSNKCYSGSAKDLAPSPALSMPHAEAQSGLASIETAAAAVATSQNAFALSTPFAEPKATIDKLNGVPAAYGDFNNDHFVDLFFITNNGYSIQAMMGKECSDGKTVLSYFGSRDCLVNWPGLECHFLEPIVNVVPSDFTGQNRLDLLVTVKSDKEKFAIILAKGGSTDLACNDRETLFTDAHSEPFVLDYNGDMIMDFIISTDTCNTFLWLGGSETASDTATSQAHQNHPLEHKKSSSGICLKNLTSEEFVFAKPHSSAFLNLENYQKNMDTDIFLAGEKEIKYIYNVEGQGFAVEENISYPKHKLRGQSAFMDINYAGQMCHLIPVCLDDTSTVFEDCKTIGLMAWHQETHQWINVLDTETANISKRPLSFLVQSFFNTITVPVTLRIGDLNYDGYPDFATTLIDITSTRTFAAIYLNVEDNETESLSNPFKRKFKLSWLSEDKFSDDIGMVSLFDLYDNGRLVLLLTKFNNEKDKSLQTVSYDYYIDHRFYYSFIRVTVVTGRCTDKEGPFQCPKRNNETEQVALGSNPHGPNACFAGPYTKQHSCSAQLTQSAHFALQFPYMIFGLGDILNVVSDLKVSIPNGPYASRMRQWEEDIPGSKLVIVPFELNSPKNWYKRVYINMGIYSMISLVFLFGLCVILVMAIYFLHCRERKEDRKDHMEYKKHWL